MDGEPTAAPEGPGERANLSVDDHARLDYMFQFFHLKAGHDLKLAHHWTACMRLSCQAAKRSAAVASAATAELRAEVEAARARAGCYLERAERAEARVAALERVLVAVRDNYIGLIHSADGDQAMLRMIAAALDGGRGAGGEAP